MSFYTDAYINSQSDQEIARWWATHTRLGWHPKTGDGFYVPDEDRPSSVHITGNPGNGKSALTENIIAQDCEKGAVIFIDPHADSVSNIVGRLPEDLLPRTRVIDVTVEAYPIGLNPLAIRRPQTSLEFTQAVDSLMYIVEVIWPQSLGQQHLPLFIRSSVIALLSNPGTSLLDVPRLLRDEIFRQKLVANVQDSSVREFFAEYDRLTPALQLQRTEPLTTRLGAMLMGRPLIRNIIGQAQNTIDFRKAIEAKEILLIKLPVKVLKQDAQLLGVIIMSLIHQAIFSFADTAPERRPGVSLVVDEFQNFVSPTFAELLTESRKFAAKTTIIHQQLAQLSQYLQDATATARTHVVFQSTLDDSKTLAGYFPHAETTVRPEDLEADVIKHLLTKGAL
ncbi:MAG TPA: hypothetical protein VFV38_21960 [Ktedonobacteraceae bacterium]|nr:hypothetical protein [Ktedonobacteraceae bacterium]